MSRARRRRWISLCLLIYLFGSHSMSTAGSRAAWRLTDDEQFEGAMVVWWQLQQKQAWTRGVAVGRLVVG